MARTQASTTNNEHLEQLDQLPAPAYMYFDPENPLVCERFFVDQQSEDKVSQSEARVLNILFTDPAIANRMQCGDSGTFAQWLDDHIHPFLSLTIDKPRGQSSPSKMYLGVGRERDPITMGRPVLSDGLLDFPSIDRKKMIDNQRGGIATLGEAFYIPFILTASALYQERHGMKVVSMDREELVEFDMEIDRRMTAYKREQNYDRTSLESVEYK